MTHARSRKLLQRFQIPCFAQMVKYAERANNIRLDLIEAMTDLPTGGGTAPEPTHDAALMLRSIQEKFRSNNPATCLQGAWITTEIAQNEPELRATFDALDPAKVHFVILGDDKADAYVLARNPAVEAFVREILGLTPSSRFTFTPQA